MARSKNVERPDDELTVNAGDACKGGITIGVRYSLKRQTYGWELCEALMRRGRAGESKPGKRLTYHANLTQVCKEILDREAGSCKSAQELIDLFAHGVSQMEARINEAVEIHQQTELKKAC